MGKTGPVGAEWWERHMTRLGQAWVKACLGQLSPGRVKSGHHLGQGMVQGGQGWVLAAKGWPGLRLTLFLAKAQQVIA